MKQIVLSLMLLVSAALAHADEIKTTLSASDAGRFWFESYRNFGWHHAAKNQRPVAGGKIAVPAELFLPAATDKLVPAMIIVHGTGGLQDNAYAWAKSLNAMGYAALVFDSFTPRGVKDVAREQSRITAMNMVGDAYAALNVLATHPKIDATKIAVGGFSKGGSVAYYSLHEQTRKQLANGVNRFAAHIGFYPGCINTFEHMQSTGAPLLMLLGGADDWTGVAPCQEIVERLKRDNVPVTTIVYDGAHHAWDTANAPHRTNWEMSYVNCRFEHRTNGAVFDMLNGVNLDTVEKSANALKSCGKEGGVTYGRHEASYQRSISDVRDWLRDVFSK